MSRDRFEFIFRTLRFDYRVTRRERIEQNGTKLKAIKSIYEKFNTACTNNYSPHSHITVDGRLATYRESCPVRVYMKSKPGRYGVKIWVTADAKTAYILNSQVYTSKIVREINQGLRVVTVLVAPYYGSGRGVTTDNFFTSIPLVNNLTLTGTIRSNKREIIQVFLVSLMH